MANLDSQSKRRIRIQGKPDDVVGYNITVYDADTGETIDNVTHAVITIDANHLSNVALTFYDVNEAGRIWVNEHDQPLAE